MHPKMPGPSERGGLFPKEVMFGDIFPEWVKVPPSFPPRLKVPRGWDLSGQHGCDRAWLTGST